MQAEPSRVSLPAAGCHLTYPWPNSEVNMLDGWPQMGHMGTFQALPFNILSSEGGLLRNKMTDMTVGVEM